MSSGDPPRPQHPPTVPAPPRPAGGGPAPVLAAGQTIDDYEIVRLLGAGGLARVYLARQVSLDRLVALKVSANYGSEARTLARLEHQHIVQVYAEAVDLRANLRLLCMQYVPGVALDRLIDALREHSPYTADGRTFLAALEALCAEDEPAAPDPGGPGARAALEAYDPAELTCWLGARLAEALAHAHGQGVIHRDVKPANILLNRAGRPFLADFNAALNTRSGEGDFGGTLAYMAPEHLDVLLSGATQGAVDARSDLYSLALVLFELLTGQMPWADLGKPRLENLGKLSRARRAGAPSPRSLRPETPELLDRLLRRCLDPQPERRFPSAAALMHALDGCRDLLQVDKGPVQQGRLARAGRARPFTLLLLLALVPQLIGSAINIGYNRLLVVRQDPAQQACFQQLVLAYNAVVYPLVVAVALAVVRWAYRGWRRLREHAGLTADEAARIRRQVLALPSWVVGLTWLGWFPGGVFFPLGLHLGAGPVAAGDAVHFLLSFVLSGLIASTYAALGVQVVVLRVLYPRLWSDPAGARAQARRELAGLSDRLRRCQLLAVVVPLVGAALLIDTGPDQLTRTFRLLLTALILLGLTGLVLATRVGHGLSRVLALLTGGPREGASTTES